MKVKISSIIDNQFPDFLRNESPLLVEFIKQYFISQEVKGAAIDLITNLDEYTKVENLTNQIKSTTLLEDISFDDSTISVSSTAGFPETYGLLKIDSEIITYTSKTEVAFNGCVRGFSGIYNDKFEFATTESDFHASGSIIENLSIIFIQKFLEKIKKQFIPGFEGRVLTDNLNQTTFIQKSKSFYTTKGTNTSFEILFNALYSEPVKVIRPSDYLFTPSSAEYRVSKDIVVEAIFGDPLLLENGTLYQNDFNGNIIAKGSISKVEEILRGDRTYYVISLDYDFNRDINVSGSVFGEFHIHSKTKITSDVSMNSVTIDVDSTVGFPNSGSLLINNEVITYTNKSITQFFGCTNIVQNYLKGTDVLVNDFAYGYSGNTAIIVRISGVINSFNEIDIANNLNVGDTIRIKSLGKTSNDIRTKNWLYNIPVRYSVKSLLLLDLNSNKYQVETIDDNIISVGDSIDIVYKDGSIIVSTILSKVNETTFIIQGQGSILFSNINYIERRINRANFTNFPELSDTTTNIQNVYENNEDIFVAATSIPTYFGEALNVSDRSLKITQNINGTSITYENHGFLSGDVVVYNFEGNNNHLGISKGTYYIKKNSSDSFSLSSSRANLATNSFIKFLGSAITGYSTLSYNDLSFKTLKNQKLFRKIPNPTLSSESVETPIGNIGILNNGVEICNYKSKDVVFYGPVQSLDVVSPGEEYDIIHPPAIVTTDSIASGLIANCEIKGSLREIRILDRGLNFTEEPSVQITGGNGEGATAKVELGLFEHSAIFETSNISNNIISFINYHGFNNAEKVIYKPDGISKVIGITTDSEYFTSNVNDYDIRLHKTYDDAISGINTIPVSYTGYAKHRFTSAQSKTKISEIVVTNSGSNYTNRKISIPSSGINTISDTIIRNNHGFKTGEKIIYESYSGSPIIGISTNTSYFVTAERDYFKLSKVAEVGINTSQDFFFKTKQYINFTSSGIGTHYFNYEPIKVELTNSSGIGLTNLILSAEIQPIFRGEITSVSVENGGEKYGQEDILNYNRQPNISIFSGSGAIIQAIVANGKIIQILIIEPGNGYFAPPEIIINGTGKNAKLTPVIQNGQLIDVIIINPGYGYDSRNITLTVLAAGSGCQLRTNAKQWTINQIERLFYSDQIYADDGLLTNSINSKYELEYVHGYAPRKLRQILTSLKYVSGDLTYQPDLILSNNIEIPSTTHSPILGWAYDGNPIYGPYGFNDETGGSVRYMKSGYKLIIDPTNRPTNSLYPEGIFVEDFIFTNEGDLDHHNGRFCVTPEFPNGIYAYFSTINGNDVQSDGIFANFFKPVFPYFIGKTYKSNPSTFNFNYQSNQDDIDINNTNWLRNTSPFKLNSTSSGYNYLFKPFDIIEQTATINSILTGSVEKLTVKNSGDNYKVNDKISFKNKLTGGSGARAIVSELKGKEINEVSIATTSFYNVEFSLYQQKGIVGLSSIPVSFNSGDIISISNLNKNRNLLEKTFFVNIDKNILILNGDVDVIAITGITTYFNVYGDLRDSQIKENDIYQIGIERIKILNIELDSSRIFVERTINGTVGAYHTTGSLLTEIPRKFYIENKNQEFNDPIFNREIYFKPYESVGVGLGTTIIFSNPGVGNTNIFIPTRTIYLPNHKLKTGEKLTYKINGGSNFIVSTDGINTTTLPNNSIVYAANYSDNFIGLSTEKIGIGSTGIFVGYNTTSPAKILYYHSFGSGDKHSLITNYDSTIGQVDRNLATVYTKSNSELLKGDIVTVQVTPNTTKTVKVAYNQFRKLLLLNPRMFSGSDVNITNNTILFPNHDYFTGQKILYRSNAPIGGLTDNSLYYVVVKNSITISLCESFYESQLESPKYIDLSSQNGGTFFEVNPQIKITKNQSLVFDLSDPSLSTLDGSQIVSAFDFKIFFDETFNNEFKSTLTNSTFSVKKIGNIGIDTTSKLTLSYDENIPNRLYYNLIPLKTLEVNSDVENVQLNNSIVYVNSSFSGTHILSGVGTTSFSYNISRYPEETKYTENVKYTTTSKNCSGPIEKIYVSSGGSNYKSLPGISSIISNNGSGAIIEVNSASIGKINNVSINDIGYDYPSDLTLIPLTQTPLVLKVIPQSSLDNITVVSPGKNYLQSPNLILLDGLTLNRILDVDLRYNIGDNVVSIVKNSKGINNITPLLIPINNTNSIKISSFTYNTETKEVTAILSESYSSLEEFPFKIGDKILVENVSILDDTLAKGFNSSSYEYARFPITAINPNIGFSDGSITYSLSDYLTETEYPGIQDPAFVTGTIIPESFFPIFSIALTKNIFLEGETIKSDESLGIVQFWNKDNELLTISTNDEFKLGALITGSGSLSSGRVDKIYNFDSKFSIKSSSNVRKGWKTEKGFIDNEFQHLPDNDYYQTFSYSLKSKIDYDTWSNPVSSLNHIAGFKKFADLEVESEAMSGITTSQEEAITDLIVNLHSEIDLNCIDDFDLVSENSYIINENLNSNELYFKSKIIQDYSELVGNRVLLIDDISLEFDGVAKDFTLKSNNLDIFSRGFSSDDVNLADNVINLNNHYFVNGEKVLYSYDDSPIGINTTNIAGIGITDKLPNEVFIIKQSESTIAFAGSVENALMTIPVPLKMTNVGVGTSHILFSSKQNSKVIISLGGIIQSPISPTNLVSQLSSTVGIATTTIFLNNIDNFFSGAFAKIDDEIVKIISIGIGTNSPIPIERGLVGTAISEHISGTTVYKLSGDYNIVNNSLHFIEPPKGPTPIGTTTNSPENVDFIGITTVLDFNGRVFLRTGEPNGFMNAYATNYVFDDISNSFNGITTSFILKSDGSNITGIETNNGSILIGEVFQSPSDFGGIVKTYGAYTLKETAGITSIRFLSSSIPQDYDANISNIPIGGSIVSFGYSGGIGLQPLVSAGGTAIVSLAGTIQSISIGNSGSGYRSGLQVVNVSVYDPNTTRDIVVGVASVTSGSVVSIDITNPGIGYTLTNPPLVRIDAPLPYDNIDLIYFSSEDIPTPPEPPGNFEVTWTQTSEDEGENFYILQPPTFTSTSSTNTMTLYYDGMLIVDLEGYAVTFDLEFSPTETIDDISINCIIDGDSYPDVFQLNAAQYPLYSPSNIGIYTFDFPAVASPQELIIVVTATKTSESEEPPGPIGVGITQIAGIGTGAKANIKIGMESNIIDVDITNQGFGFKKGELLTIKTGGETGIQTTGISYSPFKLTINEIYNQKFSGWTFGQLQIFDPIDHLFNGNRKLFPLKLDNELQSLRTRIGSPINLSATFLIFINEVLQIPGSNYNISGSSYIAFSEAPKYGCSCLILFYRGNGVSDVIDVEVISPVKPGDSAQLNDDNGYRENERVISKILSADSVETIPYPGPNVVNDINYLRPVKICLQTEDIFINNKEVTKAREIYEPCIEPTTNIIKTVGISSNIIFVENAKTFFDDQRENVTQAYRSKLKIISQEETRVAIATAIVSIAGSISDISINDTGKGYHTNPIITFANPPGFTTEYRALATAYVSNGSISSISIDSSGSNYSKLIPPEILISNPKNKFENITATSITGDFGLITGISTTNVGVSSTALTFNLYIPTDSVMRNSSISGTATTISGIQSGYYLAIKNTFIGNGITSLEQNGSILSIGTSCIDNIYSIASVSVGQTFVSGIGITAVAQVTTMVSDNNIVGIGFTKIYGTYSWGRIVTQSRNTNNEFVVYNSGISGLSSAPIIKRVNPLKGKNYS